MSRALPHWARFLIIASFATACSSRSALSSHRHAQVTVSATCSANQVRLAIESSTVQFHHTNVFNPPTDVEWRLDASSNVDGVTITPDGPWPFDGNPPFPVSKATSYNGVGKPTQDKGRYRYSITVACPNGGPTAIFDPDIWVD